MEGLMSMKKTVIKGAGRYLPPRLVTNDDLAKWMDTTDEWIRQRTGIEQRYWVPADKEIGVSDLGLEASKTALKRAGWKPEDIDLTIFATLSPDIFFPGSGCLLAAQARPSNHACARYQAAVHRDFIMALQQPTHT